MFTTKALTHRFSNGFLGLNDLSIGLEKGSLTLLAGSNGSGKTLLFRHFMGLLKPTGGEIFFQGSPLKKCLRLAREKSGMVWQDPNLQIVGQTIMEEVGFGLKARGYSQDEIVNKVQEALQLVGLTKSPELSCAPLSGGEKRRLVLASMLAEGKECLLLDEPFVGLDWEGVKAVLEVLEKLKDQGVTMMLISHDLDKFLSLVSHVVLLQEGKLLAEGSVTEIWDYLPKAQVHRPPMSKGRWEEIDWKAPC